MKTVILIGGKGTRMSPATDFCPKEMFPMINKPFLSWILDELENNNIKDEEICFVSSKEKENIFSYYSSLGRNYNVIYDSGKGLCDAILQAKDFINNEPFILILGDLYFYKANSINNLLIQWAHNRCGVIGCWDAHSEFNKHCAVYTNEVGYINNMREKPQVKDSNVYTMGQYLFTPEFLSFLEVNEADATNNNGFTQAMINYAHKYKLKAVMSNGIILDTGNPESYAKSIMAVYAGMYED